ncbi:MULTISPECIES: YgjV family protein [Desulfosediminicola]|uniref:YgjV family protein n=1 Tax=Desulfosediminicola TaxID=2886823 RepID=UPI0010ACB3C0|nr:YgjV family protein [Desulfosediminicola ganghwensis]
MSLFIASQILISIAICTDLLSFQFKNRTHIVACLAVSCLLISIHFMCLGHWTAACLSLLNSTRFFTTIFSTARVLMWIYLSITMLVFFFTYEGHLSVLGTIGALFGTVASFSKNDKRLREIMFVGTCFWLAHNILAGSPGAVVMEIIFISSNIVGYYRYYIRRPKQILK